MSIKGTIKIRKGNEYQAPTLVYVSHKNSWNAWVCEILNTTQSVFTIDESDLLDFNYKVFMQMSYDWKIKNQAIVTARLIKERQQWD